MILHYKERQWYVIGARETYLSNSKTGGTALMTALRNLYRSYPARPDIFTGRVC